MYDDVSLLEPSSKKRKMNMTLDLQQTLKPKQEKLLTSDLLATPDLSMYMLASPDLERLIIQPHGLVLTTPTPTSNILFPKSVTEEQEAYARGFTDALAELHKGNAGQVVSGLAFKTSVPHIDTATATLSMSNKPLVLTMANSSASINGNRLLATPAKIPVATAQLPTIVAVANGGNIKVEAAQTVPAVTTLPLPVSSVEVKSSLDIKPIDMNEQEHAKLERKRARNRLAATRCRNRKLERISRLEERVAELKAQNGQLLQSASALRDEVCRLKQTIGEHTSRGCQVMLTHSLL